ncbi:MAG: TonB-dependent receptor, partial [Calditrichaeota bacterium]|nr:TonB-dependent receptor [Calditrichota bacterium]
NNTNSLRATYNRAVTLPGNNSLNLDIIGQQTDFPGGFSLIGRGRGARDGYSFSNASLANGQFLASGTLPIPGIWGSGLPYQPGVPNTTYIPLAAPYALLYEGLLAQFTANPNSILSQLAQAGINVDVSTAQLLLTLLDYNPNRSGRPALPVTTINQNRRATTVLTATPVDVKPLANTITETIELGYKGIISNKLLFAVDGYYTKKKDFIGPLLLETPLVVWGRNAQGGSLLDSELAAALAEAISNNPVLLGALQSQSLTPQQVAGLLVALASEDLNALPVGVVQPNENAVPGELMLTYRNFGQVEYWGVDVTMQYLFNEKLSF